MDSAAFCWSSFIDVAGGWADAADYLQYVTTSAHATYAMLAAGRDFPRVFRDGHDANGLPGANGLIDVLDEARWGLEWLVRMHPSDDIIFNQIADDRDHAFHDLPNTDSSDYGWGKGGYRPVYPCTGKPQGLFTGKNRADGYASTPADGSIRARRAGAGWSFRRCWLQGRLRTRVVSIRALARRRRALLAPESGWVDDMVGAMSCMRRTAGALQAAEYAEREPVTP
jgi:hypothetical protein